MARYKATIVWERNDASFLDNLYSRAHRWHFDGGAEVPASSSPRVVPIPQSDPTAVDPEEAFIAALSSCHMLWYLSIAAKRGYTVDRYRDEAVGVMRKDNRGKLAITRVTLRPDIVYVGGAPSAANEAAMHHKAHDACFIANSVRTEVVIEQPASD